MTLHTRASLGEQPISFLALGSVLRVLGDPDFEVVGVYVPGDAACPDCVSAEGLMGPPGAPDLGKYSL